MTCDHHSCWKSTWGAVFIVQNLHSALKHSGSAQGFWSQPGGGWRSGKVFLRRFLLLQKLTSPVCDYDWLMAAAGDVCSGGVGIPVRVEDARIASCCCSRLPSQRAHRVRLSQSAACATRHTPTITSSLRLNRFFKVRCQNNDHCNDSSIVDPNENKTLNKTKRLTLNLWWQFASTCSLLRQVDANWHSHL